MNRVTQSTVMALSLAVLLGTGACASDPGTNPTPTEIQTKAASVEKPEGFSDHVAAGAILPEGWDGSSGWLAVTGEATDNVFEVGEYLAYLEGKLLQPDGNTEFAGRLIFVDQDGNKSYPVTEQPAPSTDIDARLEMVTRNGVPYLVYAEEFTEMGDESSMSQSSGEQPATSVTVFDGEGTLLHTVKIDGTLDFGHGDTVRAVTPNGESSSLLEVETGELLPMPVLDGHDWVGNYDGVNVFVSSDSPRTLTNGNWVYAAPDASKEHPTIIPLGTAIALEESDPCTVFDPHSGIEYSELSGEGICAWNEITVASQDGSLIAWRSGIYSFPDKKFTPIGSDISFRPQSIMSNGDVYGEGADKIGVVNAFKGGDPRVLPDVTLAPRVATADGLAAFQIKDDDVTVFVVGKDH